MPAVTELGRRNCKRSARLRGDGPSAQPPRTGRRPPGVGRTRGRQPARAPVSLLSPPFLSLVTCPSSHLRSARASAEAFGSLFPVSVSFSTFSLSPPICSVSLGQPLLPLTFIHPPSSIPVSLRSRRYPCAPQSPISARPSVSPALRPDTRPRTPRPLSLAVPPPLRRAGRAGLARRPA